MSSSEPPAPAQAEPPPAAPVTAGPSIAVLYFQNLGNDPELEWLRSGIADLLVTDLSQSPEIKVLSTGRLYKILDGLDAIDQPALSFDVIEEVARLGAVAAVVRGSFARAGGVLRIAFTVEDATSGEILASNHFDGKGDDGPFSVVDQVAAAIRRSFEVARPTGAPMTVEGITTSSLKAWRHFSEALVLHRQSKRRDAIEALEKAVEIDPEFALAFANLGRYHGNLGQTELAQKYSQRALELAERLPVDQRDEIEGVFNANRWSTVGRALEAFERVLRRYPDRERIRNNLASLYTHQERYEEALREYLLLIEDDTDHPGTYVAAAQTHAALGRFETAHSLLDAFAQRNPENWFVRLGLGWLLTDWGKLDEAVEQFQRAAELRPGEMFIHYGRWRTEVLREDWRQAESEADNVYTVGDPFARWRGAVSRARNLTYRGRSLEALRHLDDAIAAHSDPEAFTALAHCWKAELLLARGDARQALTESLRAREIGRGEWPELLGLFLAALSYQRLDQASEAGRMEAELRRQAENHPNSVEERQLHHLAGRLALARSDADGAVSALTQAEALLPAEGVEFHWHVYPDHVPIWYALGEAQLAAGRPGEAEGWFRRAVTSGSEHVESPLSYARGFYQLGLLHLQRGETVEACRDFSRFLELWQDGDLDREGIDLALAMVSGCQATQSS